MARALETIDIRFIESPKDMVEVWELEDKIWPGDNNPVPYHMLVAIVHNGGGVIRSI